MDKKIDHLVATVTATPVAANSAAVKGNGPTGKNDPLPKNTSELTGFAINKLGKLGPPVLVAAILVGGYVGLQEIFSTINQRDESVRKTFTETAVATLEVGESVVKNTEKLISLNEKLGSAGEKLLKLQVSAAEEAGNAVTEKQNAVREKQNAVRAAREADDLRAKLTAKETLLDKSTENVKAKDKELSRLRDQLTQGQKLLEQSEVDLKNKQSILVKEQGEIELAKANVAEREGLLKDKDARLLDTQSTINSLNEELKRLRAKNQTENARSKKALSDLRTKTEALLAEQKFAGNQLEALQSQNSQLVSSLEEARNTIRKFGDAAATIPELPKIVDTPAEPMVVARPSQIEVITDVLQRFAVEPESVTFDTWLQMEDEDPKFSEIDALLKTDLGFEAVYKLVLKDDDANEILYLPVRQITSDQFVDTVDISIKQDSTGWRVSPTIPSFTLVRLRDIADFNRTQVVAIIDEREFEDENYTSSLVKFQSDVTALKFSELLREFFSGPYGTEIVSIDVHYGEDENAVRILGINSATTKYPALIKRWMEEDKSAMVAEQMESRAIEYDADSQIPIDLFGTEMALRTTLVDLIAAAVSGNTTEATSLLANPLTVADLGRLAAIALRGELVFEEAPVVQLAQTIEPVEKDGSSTSLPAASATVFASVRQADLDPPVEDVEFRFRRESGTSRWMLIGFGAGSKKK